MKKARKLTAFLLSALCALGVATGCGGSTGNNAPDYSKSKQEYTIWAYSGTRGNWYEEGDYRYYYENGSRLTAENTALYADGGFNVLFADWSIGGYDGPIGYETSEVKKALDYAEQVGIKAFVYTKQLAWLSQTEESLINPEKAALAENKDKFFATEADLEAYVAAYLAPLKEHPAFYGCSLKDEPKYTMLKAMGQVYRAIQKAAPDCFVNMNLNPMYEGVEFMYCPEGNSIGVVTGYKKYLDNYYEEIGQYCGYVQYDDYPILKDGAILGYHLHNAQIVADYCKEKGMTFGKVFQTCAYQADLVRTATTEADMRWQMNIGMAMGIKDYSYFTYYPRGWYPNQEWCDTAFIVDLEGKPTHRYYWLKDIHKEMQFNARALMNFEYQALNYVVKTPIPGSKTFLAGVKSETLTDVKSITMDSAGIILTTEQYDKVNNQRGYFVMNATAPSQATEIKVTLQLKKGKTHVQVWNGNKVVNKAAKDGKVSFYLETGEGVFVLPY